MSRMLIASSVMGSVCWVGWHAMSPHRHAWMALPLIVAVGVVVYTACCRLLHIEELSRVFQWLKTLPLVARFVTE